MTELEELRREVEDLKIKIRAILSILERGHKPRKPSSDEQRRRKAERQARWRAKQEKPNER